MKKVAEELRQILVSIVPKLKALRDPEVARRPAPAKWSRKEILGHLIDSACNNHQKFVRAMQQPHIDFPGYRQEEWVSLQNWAQANWEEVVALWETYNKHIAYIIENVDVSHLQNTITIEGAGPFTLEFIMSDYVEHLKHHLKQIFPELTLENHFVDIYKT